MEVIASSGLGCWEGESHLLDHFHRTRISSPINSQTQQHDHIHKHHHHHQDLIIQSSLISFICCYKYLDKRQLKEQRAYTGSQFECMVHHSKGGSGSIRWLITQHPQSGSSKRWSLVPSSFSQPREQCCLRLRWVSTPQLTQSRKSLEDIPRGLFPEDGKAHWVDKINYHSPQLVKEIPLLFCFCFCLQWFESGAFNAEPGRELQFPDSSALNSHLPQGTPATFSPLGLATWASHP